MGFDKGHREFYTLDMSEGWHSRLRATRRASSRRLSPAHSTRRASAATAHPHLRLDPGAFSTAPVVHDYWEEVFVLSGDLIVGNDAEGRGGEVFPNYTHAVRPPGVHHGPFKSETGCMLLETHRDRRHSAPHQERHGRSGRHALVYRAATSGNAALPLR